MTLLTLVCSLGGFFGAFGIAHHTRLLIAKYLFYPLSMLYLSNFFVMLRSDQHLSTVFYEMMVCASALTFLIYALAVDHYWRTHKRSTSQDIP